MAIQSPECYVLAQTKFCPNNDLPYLVYRNVLPPDVTEQIASELLTKHGGWERFGPVWGPVSKRHFHPNVHECYAILSGTSTFLLGLAMGDSEADVEAAPEAAVCNGVDVRSSRGLRLRVSAGDVVVQPAGTGHSCLDHDGNFRYISLFVSGAPHWRSSIGNTPVDEETRQGISQIPLPEFDPVYGKDGALQKLWGSA
ncbi:cupin domain protein [Colletotrichum chrysophilum]|uniref:Cupin domain protein n=1 Tax=Colletotrichum chrysophilum TaxID=1836956 RepID=A0AAD9ECI1_9PEZI|nr:cupin domain protein [Colletotrichum chrysophilum]